MLQDFLYKILPSNQVERFLSYLSEDQKNKLLVIHDYDQEHETSYFANLVKHIHSLISTYKFDVSYSKLSSQLEKLSNKLFAIDQEFSLESRKVTQSLLLKFIIKIINTSSYNLTDNLINFLKTIIFSNFENEKSNIPQPYLNRYKRKLVHLFADTADILDSSIEIYKSIKIPKELESKIDLMLSVDLFKSASMYAG